MTGPRFGSCAFAHRHVLELRSLGRLVLQHGDEADLDDALPWQSAFHKANAIQPLHAIDNPRWLKAIATDRHGESAEQVVEIRM